MFDALDGKEVDEEDESGEGPKEKKPAADINYRDEPVAFFFVLFGLAFEALVTTGKPSSGDSQSNKEHTLAILRALKNILKPSVSGHAIYQEVVFSETMDMLDRLVLTEGLDVQEVIVEIARNLCRGHPSAQRGQKSVDSRDYLGQMLTHPYSVPNGEETLSDDIEQLFELTRIIVLVLAGLIPGLGDNNAQGLLLQPYRRSLVLTWSQRATP